MWSYISHAARSAAASSVEEQVSRFKSKKVPTNCTQCSIINKVTCRRTRPFATSKISKVEHRPAFSTTSNRQDDIWCTVIAGCILFFVQLTCFIVCFNGQWPQLGKVNTSGKHYLSTYCGSALILPVIPHVKLDYYVLFRKAGHIYLFSHLFI